MKLQRSVEQKNAFLIFVCGLNVRNVLLSHFLGWNHVVFALGGTSKCAPVLGRANTNVKRVLRHHPRI